MNEGKQCVCKENLIDDGAGNCDGESKYLMAVYILSMLRPVPTRARYSCPTGVG